jgi:hypothetical protein
MGKVVDSEYVVRRPCGVNMYKEVFRYPCDMKNILKNPDMYRANTDNMNEITDLKKKIFGIIRFDVIYNFKEYKEHSIINSEREFQNGDKITIENIDYPVIYKYKIKENRHELYIDYKFITDEEKENKKKYSAEYDGLLKLILETNEEIYTQIENIKAKNREKTNKSLMNKTKRIFKRS